jgi:alkaline phosphatase D
MSRWARRPFDSKRAEERLTLEVSEGASFTLIIATAPAIVSQASDWMCRVLVGGLKPRHVY